MILSLDLSTKNSGYAIFDSGKLITYGDVKSSSTDLIKRIYIMINKVQELLENNADINKIIVEEVRPEGGSGVGNQKTMKALMYLQAKLEFLIYDNFKGKVSIEYTYPSSWRSICGIKNGRGVTRATAKEADIVFVKENFNIDVNDDIADAICIGYSYFKPKEPTEFIWE